MTEDNVPAGKLKEKNMNNLFFGMLKVTVERSLVRRRIRIHKSEVGIVRIRNKMSRIPNAARKKIHQF
jgi:hypothetical protein